MLFLKELRVCRNVCAGGHDGDNDERYPFFS